MSDGVLVERNRQRSPLGRTDQCVDGISHIGTEGCAVPMLTVQEFPSALSVPTTLAARPLSARSLLRALRLALRDARRSTSGGPFVMQSDRRSRLITITGTHRCESQRLP